MICSSSAVSVLRLIVNTPEIASQLVTLCSGSLNDTANHVVSLMVARKSIKLTEINILYYFLIKLGENSLREIMSRCNVSEV